MESYELLKIIEALKQINHRLNEIESSSLNFTSKETKALETDFTKAQGEFKPVIKDKENKFLKFKYASFDAMADYARSILPKHNLNFKQHLIDTKNGTLLITRLNHVSGQWSESRMRITLSLKPKNQNENQELGATITYFKRYSLGSLLGLSVGDIDLDA